MSANADTGRAAVTFVRSGLQVGGQVHLAGTCAELPVEIALLSPDEQVDELGAHYFVQGIEPGAIPASESYLAERPDLAERTSPLLTTPEVAALLRVTPGHVREMVRRGMLEEVRIGDGPRAKMRFRRSALTRYLGPPGDYIPGRTPPVASGSYGPTGEPAPSAAHMAPEPE